MWSFTGIPARLCWPSAHLMQYGPDYSLNWTARSCAIQGRQRCQCCNLPTRRWPSQSRRPFGLKSAMEQLTVQHECQTVSWKASARSNCWSSLCVKMPTQLCNTVTANGSEEIFLFYTFIYLHMYHIFRPFFFFLSLFIYFCSFFFLSFCLFFLPFFVFCVHCNI